MCVHAPAGYGKSSLVSRWLDVCGLAAQAAWVTLDESDAELTQFVHYVAAALETIRPGAMSLVQPILEDAQGNAARALMHLIAKFSELAPADSRHAHALLVLDDLHRVHAPAVKALVQTLLENGPDTLHLILLARHRADLSLARLYAHEKLIELTKDDLRFTEEEISTYLRRHGFAPPSSTDLTQLALRSEGWVTALQLAVLSLPKSDCVGDVLKALQGNLDWLAQFLTDEVLNHQTPAIRRFLLQTSILDKFCASLCDAVTGESKAQRYLAALTRADLFLIRLDLSDEGGEDWFRYHPLFQAMLMRRLQAETAPRFIDEYHHRAGDWFACAGHVPEAVQYLLTAGAEDAASDVVQRQLHGALRRSPYEAKRLFDLLPARCVHRRPRLLLDRCILCMLFDDRQHIDEWLQLAKDAIDQHFPVGSATDDVQAMHSEWLIMSAGSAFMHKELAEARRLLDQAAPTETIADLIVGLAYFLRMHLHRYAGEHTAALECADHAIGAFERTGFSLGTVAIRREMARWSMRLGDGKAATRQFNALFAAWQRDQLFVTRDIVLAHFFAAQNDFWQNQLEPALRHQQSALSLASQLQDDEFIYAMACLGRFLNAGTEAGGNVLEAIPIWPASLAANNIAEHLLFINSHAFISAGRIDLAQQCMQCAGVDLQRLPTTPVRPSLIAALYVYIAEGAKLADVSPILDAALQSTIQSGERMYQLHLLALAAWRLLKLGGVESARTMISLAIQLAQEIGYARMILSIPDLAASLSIADFLSPSNESAYEQLAADKARLTGVEQAVLNLLATDHAYQEIAAELMMSVNTVRTHVRSIYRKLAVHRRMQAIAEARRQGLLI